MAMGKSVKHGHICQCIQSNLLVILVTCIVLLTLIIPHISANTEKLEVVRKPQLQYCSFFANRAPEIQLGLKNCTWFKENSCCRQEEIDAIFPRVKPLRGASPACQRYTNYLMCYVCAPNQNTFYLRERLTVCEEFCDAWYDACQTAILKGSVIKDLYSNGSEYCDSRRFIVQPAARGNCFFFDARQDKSGAAAIIEPMSSRSLWLYFGLLVTFIASWIPEYLACSVHAR